jgi:hypothetical protein
LPKIGQYEYTRVKRTIICRGDRQEAGEMDDNVGYAILDHLLAILQTILS